MAWSVSTAGRAASSCWSRSRTPAASFSSTPRPTGTLPAPSPAPRRGFRSDYPPTLTAHDIGVKDLLDAFYMQGGTREVVLYAISIDPLQSISMELSSEVAGAVQEAEERILVELFAAVPAA